jgi:hypothetical protein
MIKVIDNRVPGDRYTRIFYLPAEIDSQFDFGGFGPAITAIFIDKPGDLA